MSKWRFEAMSIDDARRILESDDKGAESYRDRVSARHLLERRFADDGWAPRPLASYRIPAKKGVPHG